MPFDHDNVLPPGPAARIKVIGVGGGGGNAVNTMIRSSLDGVDFITVNTDVQALRFSLATSKLQVGKALTRGLGAGADPDIGRDAALEDRHEIQQILSGADMVFITAGMGGGTGTGGAAVVAQIARELGALTVAVVTKPFAFEGKRRRKHAELGIARLRECVDTLITIPNQRLLQVASPSLSMIDAFKMADDVLVNAVRGISDIINVPGEVNVDFADVKTIMSCMGQALMGIGSARGEGRASKAARMAICSPLLEDIDIEGATGILINITAGSDVGLMEVSEACSIVQEAAHEDANIIFGAVIDNTLGDELRVTVIATGFPVDKEELEAVSNANMSRPATPKPSPFASRLATPFGLATPAAPAATSHPEVSSASGVAPATPSHPAASPFAMAAMPRHQDSVNDWSLASPASSQIQPLPPAQAPFEVQPLMGASFDEAQELTRWTLDHQEESGQEASGEEDLSSLAGEPSRQDTVSSHVGYEQPLQHEPLVEADLAARLLSAIPQQVTSDSLLSPAEMPLAKPTLPTSDLRPGAVKESPFTGIFDVSGGFMATDIDRKIDEALELAERMRTPRISPTDDDLDVPAFLRNGMKDLPLE